MACGAASSAGASPPYLQCHWLDTTPPLSHHLPCSIYPCCFAALKALCGTSTHTPTSPPSPFPLFRPQADTLVPPQLAAAVHNPWAGVAGAVIMCTGTLYNVASAGFGTHHTALAALSLLNLLHQTATARRQSGIKAGALQVL
eukprot:TRINITY_DN1379_c0_g1_i1.p2 TRINITY_DN1379_c0_g1~~TRINITY_DN1379_c0_g1_i1.p2  ORF type:complete len:143 (-),score=4.61 TRINITY_DN1379_c0_g1_i1:702-1130(-)